MAALYIPVFSLLYLVQQCGAEGFCYMALYSPDCLIDFVAFYIMCSLAPSSLVQVTGELSYW